MLTKYGHFIALKHPYTAKDIADLFLKEVHRLHGLPKTIVIDRDPIFTSQFWQQLFKSMGTKLTMSTSYHPQTDGQTKRLHRCLETYLRSMVFANPKLWLRWLPMVEWWYNTNHHTALKATPFEALYGFSPSQVPLGPLPYSTNTQEGACMAQRQHILQQLKENLQVAQARMKFFADKNRTERVLNEGDMVYLKLQPYN